MKGVELRDEDVHNVVASGQLMILDIRQRSAYEERTLMSSLWVKSPEQLLKAVQRERQHQMSWKRFLILADTSQQDYWQECISLLSSNFQSPRHTCFVAHPSAYLFRHLRFVCWSPASSSMSREEEWAMFERMSPPHRILPYLYLGSYLQAMNVEVLRSLRCVYVVNATGGQFGNRHEDQADFHYLEVDVQDDSVEDISVHFERVSQFVRLARKDGKCCLIHCAEGKSRSSSLVLAYLMQNYNMSLQQASKLTKRRSLVMPNGGFTMQLLKYERRLSEDQESPLPEGDNEGRAPTIDKLYGLLPLPEELKQHPDQADLQIDTHGMIWKVGLNKVVGWKREDGSVLLFDAEPALV